MVCIEVISLLLLCAALIALAYKRCHAEKPSGEYFYKNYDIYFNAMNEKEEKLTVHKMTTTKSTSPHIAKALSDESIFPLLGRDETAPEVVLEWIRLNIRRQPREKLLSAFNSALDMVEAHEEIAAKATQMKKDFRAVTAEDFTGEGAGDE